MNELEAGARHGSFAPRGLARGPGSRGDRYTRLFPFLAPCDVDDLALEALVERLGVAAAAPGAENRENTAIPAGFTYLGQFIDHDLTFDAMSSIQPGNDPHALVNFRTPRFDLDSLYGSGPADQPFLYDWSKPDPGDSSTPDAGVRLLVGHNPVGGCDADVDLPRNDQGRAIIGDPRNDEHLIIAQLHLLFIKFHNRVAGELRRRDRALTGNALFDAARRAVQWHYQWIVTHDHLAAILGDVRWQTLRPRIDDHLRDAERPGPLWDLPAIPVEFSAAVYRFGHSMVRPTYPINLHHSDVPILPPGDDDGLHLGGFRRLPATLQIHWPKFFGAGAVPSMKIDHRLTGRLSALPPDDAKLAHLNLARGAAFGLPSGHDVALAMGEKPLGPAELYPDGFWPATTRADARAAVLASPPLWFYVLREAVARGGRGAYLGPVGGRIVAEVLIGLLEADPSSYLNAPEPWTPAMDGLPSTMAELVAFTLRED